VVIFRGAGTDGDDPTFTFLQGTDVAFGTNKALDFTTYYAKEGTLTAVGTWTKVTKAAGNTLAPGDPSAQSQAVYVVEFDAADFEVDVGYDSLRATPRTWAPTLSWGEWFIYSTASDTPRHR
jgi:hypothetical protein